MKFDGYDTEEFYDEMIMSNGDLKRRQLAAEAAFMNRGVTFNVYGWEGRKERIFPFDIVPRIIEAAEWDWVERWLKQRVRALNCFIDDVYHEHQVFKALLEQTRVSMRLLCITRQG